jgi:hypothetical protein
MSGLMRGATQLDTPKIYQFEAPLYHAGAILLDERYRVPPRGPLDVRALPLVVDEWHAGRGRATGGSRYGHAREHGRPWKRDEWVATPAGPSGVTPRLVAEDGR